MATSPKALPVRVVIWNCNMGVHTKLDMALPLTWNFSRYFCQSPSVQALSMMHPEKLADRRQPDRPPLSANVSETASPQEFSVEGDPGRRRESGRGSASRTGGGSD